MKSLLGLVLLSCLPGLATAQRVKRKGVEPIDVSKNKTTMPRFTLADFAGKWQEVERLDESDKPVAFTDTLFITILPEGKGDVRQGNHARMRGEVSLQPDNQLMIVTDLYEIKKRAGSALVLLGDEGTYTFEKRDAFWSDSMKIGAVAQAEYSKPVAPMAAALAGDWRVYRKQSPPGADLAGQAIISRITLTGAAWPLTGTVVYAVLGKSVQEPCSVTEVNGGIKITAGGKSWELLIYKMGDELVFGTAGSLLYYAKPAR